jgi:hypothetical protein
MLVQHQANVRVVRRFDMARQNGKQHFLLFPEVIDQVVFPEIKQAVGRFSKLRGCLRLTNLLGADKSVEVVACQVLESFVSFHLVGLLALPMKFLIDPLPTWVK